MDYYKKKYFVVFLLALIIIGCTKDSSSDNEIKELKISVVGFNTSYNQVKINWEVIRPKDVIIQELLIYRSIKNDNYIKEEIIGNLPSNETNFIDENVPYESEITYKIKLSYVNQSTNAFQNLSLESESKKFIREIVKFDRLPFQVQKDPIHPEIFHILDKEGIGYLKKYNSIQNKIIATKTFTNGGILNNRFHIVNNSEIYLADTKGKIFKINSNDYITSAIYSTNITDNLNAFAISNDRIYYQDEEVLNFYTISTALSISGGIATSADYMEEIGNNNFLFLYSQNGSGMKFFSFTPENCNSTLCSPGFGITSIGQNLSYNGVDPNIFTWNSSKTKFITSIDGRVFNISNLKQEKVLNSITGKKYFQYAFDNDGNIYATVQGEKKIHKFNSSYELVGVIQTKLYPFYPIVSNNKLNVIGGYEPITYWSFEYGYNFNFGVKCAIEML